MSNFNIKDINTVENAGDLSKAKQLAKAILFKSSKQGGSKRPIHFRRIAYLMQRIQDQKTIPGVLSVLYNMYLSGEGLSVNSNNWYQKTIPGFKKKEAK